MMEPKTYEAYVNILRAELVPALGCTEPIAIAYAAATARDALLRMPDRINMCLSGNVIKNVMGVTVPGSGGLKGIAIAAALGTVGGDASKKLEVLSGVTAADVEAAQAMVANGQVHCALAEGEEGLFIEAEAVSGDDRASVVIRDEHTNIVEIRRQTGALLGQDGAREACELDESNDWARNQPGGEADRALLSVRGILEFADALNIEDVREIMERQIALNTAIAEEGLKNAYGSEVGRTLLEVYGDDIRVRSRAKPAAGSDARMSGCAMPVVINSGSGNQGMTVSLPVIEYAAELHAPRERLIRALVVANLISIHQKKYIGALSAYCGAISAACGAACGICTLHGGGFDEVARTITNTICNVGGIVCDGAKPSCAAKIASALDAAIMGFEMSQKRRVFQPGEGLAEGDVEETIQNLGRLGRVGMKATDIEIIKMMIGE